MFGLSMTEIILIAIIALVVVGPKKLPDIAKSIGKGYGEFKRTFNDLKESVNIDTDTSSPTKSSSNSNRHDELKKELAESYKSQWEQKLPTDVAKNDSDKPASSDEVDKRG